MQEMISKAALLQAAQEQAPDSSQPPAGRAGLGRRQFAAMIWAIQNPCQCHSCNLLRQEIGDLIGDLLSVEPKGAAGTDTVPVPNL